MPATSTSIPRNVLITGASTGIGAACARMLAGRGWRVFAGVRKIADGESLVAGAEGQIIPVILDVTNREQIKTVVQEVSTQCGAAGLQGVVNNAGIALAGPLEFMPMEAFERQFEINVLGLIAVTKAVMPLIRAGHGRIVLMGSNSGFMCEPFLAGYGATKHALEAIADSLRIELRPDANGEYLAVLTIERTSGSHDAWLRLNRPFMGVLRRHWPASQPRRATPTTP